MVDRSGRKFAASLIALVIAATATQSLAVDPTMVPRDGAAQKFLVGHLPDLIPESSGLVESRKHAGVFWTHNDSGNAPQIFAVDRKGKLLATFSVNIANVDWEDIATDDAGHLYISETGNNNRRRDRRPAVYRVDEPDVSLDQATTTPVTAQEPLKVTARYLLRYAAEPFDCESLFIWKDHGYVISKLRDGGLAELYRFPLVERPLPVILESVCTLPIRAPVTGADISVDGKRLLVLTVFGPNLFEIDGDPKRAGTVPPKSVLFMQPDMEGGALVKEGVLATTESQYILLFPDSAFNEPAAAVPTEAKLAIAHQGKPIAVDGVLDDWDKSATNLPVKFDPPTSPAATTAHLWCTWTSAGLYVAATVPKDQPSPMPTEWYGGDVVEIFVGRQSESRLAEYGDGDERCYIGFSANPDGKRGDVVLKWPRKEQSPTDQKVAGVVNEDGTFSIEAFLPAGAFGDKKPLAAGSTFRLNVSILATHPRRNWFLSESNSAGSWMSPLKWDIATLK